MFEELTKKAQEEVMGALYESAQTQAQESPINKEGVSQFVAYEPNPDRFGFQTLSVAWDHLRVIGNPPITWAKDEDKKRQELKRLEKNNELASFIDKRYPNLVESLDRLDKESGIPGQIEEIQRSGQNVILGFDHSEFVDIELGLVAASNRQRLHEVPHRSMSIISKAVDYLGINLEYYSDDIEGMVAYLHDEYGIKIEPDNTIHARELLRLAADITYLSIPGTQSFDKIRGLQGTAIKGFNIEILSMIKRNMNRRGIRNHLPMLAGIALPGSVNKILDIAKYQDGKLFPGLYETYPAEFETSGQVEVICSINPGILTFAGGALTFASAVRLNNPNAAFAIDNKFKSLQTLEDIDFISTRQVELANGLNESGLVTISDRKGNLPLIRKGTQDLVDD